MKEMKSIGVRQCLIPLSKGEGYQPNFPLDFSLQKLKECLLLRLIIMRLKN